MVNVYLLKNQWLICLYNINIILKVTASENLLIFKPMAFSILSRRYIRVFLCMNKRREVSLILRLFSRNSSAVQSISGSLNISFAPESNKISRYLFNVDSGISSIMRIIINSLYEKMFPFALDIMPILMALLPCKKAFESSFALFA